MLNSDRTRTLLGLALALMTGVAAQACHGETAADGTGGGGADGDASGGVTGGTQTGGAPSSSGGGGGGGVGGLGPNECASVPSGQPCPEGCQSLRAYEVDTAAACIQSVDLLPVACLDAEDLCGQAPACARRKADGAYFYNPANLCLLEPALAEEWEECDDELNDSLAEELPCAGGAGG